MEVNSGRIVHFVVKYSPGLCNSLTELNITQLMDIKFDPEI